MRNVNRLLAVTLRLHVRPQLFRVVHVVQKSKHLAELGDSIGRNAFCNVVYIEFLKTLMDETSYLQLNSCSP